ncbi:GNAT family N-acetyltransferase [Spirillospora sp. NPDC029432]|uniref:GNAT family N-acetyltransferase n=1 Tax=Spirillospora sp. NPDC029432 TaxID=3154599 RepID=UPI0034557902
MGVRFRLCPASPGDLPSVLDLIDSAAGWLRTKGTTQWQRPWPDREQRDQRVLDALERGQTWLLMEEAAPVATVTLTRTPNVALWTARQRAQPALYLHRLVVDRGRAGLGIGAHLLDWAGVRAREWYGARWLRIDVWTDNYALHRYYRERGFKRLRQSPGIPDYPAGALFQKDTASIRPNRRLPFEVGPRLAYEAHSPVGTRWGASPPPCPSSAPALLEAATER